MVSRFRYLSGKDLDPTHAHPGRVHGAGAARLRAGRVRARPEMLFALFAVYALSGPVAVGSGAVCAAAAGRPPGDAGTDAVMVNARQAAYLQALGVDVYVPRGSAPPLEAGCRSQPASVGTPRRAVGGAAAAARRRAGRDRAPAVVLAGRSAAATRLGPVARGRRGLRALRRCTRRAPRRSSVSAIRDARWMFIGEAPGAEEDRQGEPFVGRAGQLLTAMIRALGLRREDVFIANVLKCRPPGNRDPSPQEAAALPRLPRAADRAGEPDAHRRGRAHRGPEPAGDGDADRQAARQGARLRRARLRRCVVTYHPAYLLRSPGEKRKAWAGPALCAPAVRARWRRRRPCRSGPRERGELHAGAGAGATARALPRDDAVRRAGRRRASSARPTRSRGARASSATACASATCAASPRCEAAIVGYGIVAMGAGEAHVLNLCVGRGRCAAGASAAACWSCCSSASRQAGMHGGIPRGAAARTRTRSRSTSRWVSSRSAGARATTRPGRRARGRTGPRSSRCR